MKGATLGGAVLAMAFFLVGHEQAVPLLQFVIVGGVDSYQSLAEGPVSPVESSGLQSHPS